MIRKCAECGKEFTCRPSDKTVTCSRECRCKRRSRLLSGHKNSDETRSKISNAAKKQNRDMGAIQGKGTEAAMRSPKAGRFVTNSSAKRWILQAPDGTRYKCTNLMEFIRKNGRLFGINGDNDKEVRRIYAGFSALKKGQKAQTRLSCNGGWSLRLHPDDDKKNCER